MLYIYIYMNYFNKNDSIDLNIQLWLVYSMINLYSLHQLQSIPHFIKLNWIILLSFIVYTIYILDNRFTYIDFNELFWYDISLCILLAVYLYKINVCCEHTHKTSQIVTYMTNINYICMFVLLYLYYNKNL